MPQTSLLDCKTKKSCPILKFARFDSLVCIVARSRENLARSRSHRFSLAAARSRSLTGLNLRNMLKPQQWLIYPEIPDFHSAALPG